MRRPARSNPTHPPRHAAAVIATLTLLTVQGWAAPDADALDQHRSIAIDKIRQTTPDTATARVIHALHDADLEAAIAHLRTGWASIDNAGRARLCQDVVDLAVIRRDYAVAGYFEHLTGGVQALDESPFKHFGRYPSPSIDATRRVRVPYDGFTCPARIQATGEELPIRCIIDTGAQVSAITRTAASTLGLTVDDLAFDGAISGAGDRPEWGSTSLPLLRLGAARFRDTAVLVIPDGVVTQFGLDPMTAILGLPELTRFGTVDFDFRRSQLRLQDATPLYDEEPTRNAAFLGGKLYVQLRLDDEPIAGLIDTGTPTTILHDPERWIDRTDTPWGCDIREWTAPESDKTQRLIRCDVPFTLGTTPVPGPFLVLPNQDSQPFSYDMIIGNDRWKTGLLRIDFRDLIASFE